MSNFLWIILNIFYLGESTILRTMEGWGCGLRLCVRYHGLCSLDSHVPHYHNGDGDDEDDDVEDARRMEKENQ